MRSFADKRCPKNVR